MWLAELMGDLDSDFGVFFFLSNEEADCKECGLLLWSFINLCGKINIKLIIKDSLSTKLVLSVCKDLFTYCTVSSAEKETVLSNIARLVLSSHQTLTFQHQEISYL